MRYYTQIVYYLNEKCKCFIANIIHIKLSFRQFVFKKKKRNTLNTKHVVLKWLRRCCATMFLKRGVLSTKFQYVRRRHLMRVHINTTKCTTIIDSNSYCAVMNLTCTKFVFTYLNSHARDC